MRRVLQSRSFSCPKPVGRPLSQFFVSTLRLHHGKIYWSVREQSVRARHWRNLRSGCSSLKLQTVPELSRSTQSEVCLKAQEPPSQCDRKSGYSARFERSIPEFSYPSPGSEDCDCCGSRELLNKFLLIFGKPGKSEKAVMLSGQGASSLKLGISKGVAMVSWP